jgi:hypothetical protein
MGILSGMRGSGTSSFGLLYPGRFRAWHPYERHSGALYPLLFERASFQASSICHPRIECCYLVCVREDQA